MRSLCVFVALSLVLAAACGGLAPAPPASPSPAASVSPGTASPAPTSVTASPTPIPLPTFALLAAPSRDVLWALVAGDHLFRSTDRGETWERRALPETVNVSISFADERHGWLSSVGPPGTGCQFQDLTLWRTVDGAATWTRLDASGIPSGGCKRGLSFVDATHGFIARTDAYHAPVVSRTSDGGLTWTASAPLADPPGFVSQLGAGVSLEADAPRAFGATVLVAAAGQHGGRYDRYVFRSTDGGATWAYVATAPSFDGTLVFVSATRWLQIALPGGHHETTDGGASWHAFASDYSQAAPIAPQIVFGDADVGYATVRGGMQRTLDGALHWSSIETPGTARAIVR